MVINYLTEKGIEKSRFVEKGRKADDNIAMNESETGRRLNRRVEVRILKGDSEKVVTSYDEVSDEIRFKQYESMVGNRQGRHSSCDRPECIWKYWARVGYKIEWIIAEKGYIYYFGDFKDKAEASKALNFALERGFKAELVDYFKLNKMNKFVVKNTA